mgnify:CR=1 FL=1
MKKIKYLLFTCGLFLFVGYVYAVPQYSISVSSKSIMNGQKVSLTVSISNTMDYDITVVSSGSTSGCNDHWVTESNPNGDNLKKSFTTTCRATSTGTINFNITGTLVQNDMSTHEISESRSVTVTEYIAAEKSSVNTLNSLEIEGYELTPTFDPNVLEYNLTVPAGTESIMVNITKKDSRSVANGDFKEVSLSEGLNKLQITVTAEDGGKKTYVILVTVESENPITVTVDGKEYTVVTKADSLEKPNYFESKTIEMEEQAVPAFYNEKANITLVGLKDSDGNINLYIYDEESKSYRLYEVIEINGFAFMVMTPSDPLKEYEKAKTIRIGEKDYTVYYHDNEDFVLIYGLNLITGNIGWYQYDVNEQTFQRYVPSEEKEVEKSKDYFMIAMLFAGCLAASIIILLILLAMYNSKDKKNKKLIAMIESKMNPHDEPKDETPVLMEEPPKKEKKWGKKVDSPSDEELERTSAMDMKFLEFIEREAEESRNQDSNDGSEEQKDNEGSLEDSKELSRRELKKLAKELQKKEAAEAKALRDDFLSTQENEILGDTDIIEEVQAQEEYTSNKKKKKKKKKK